LYSSPPLDRLVAGRRAAGLEQVHVDRGDASDEINRRLVSQADVPPAPESVVSHKTVISHFFSDFFGVDTFTVRGWDGGRGGMSRRSASAAAGSSLSLSYVIYRSIFLCAPPPALSSALKLVLAYVDGSSVVETSEL
jgi:hypothetical protein